MNEIIFSKNNLGMKRLWNPDTNACEDGRPGQEDEGNVRIGCPPRRMCVAMIVSGTIPVNLMNQALQQNRYTRYLQLPILLAEQ